MKYDYKKFKVKLWNNLDLLILCRFIQVEMYLSNKKNCFLLRYEKMPCLTNL